MTDYEYLVSCVGKAAAMRAVRLGYVEGPGEEQSGVTCCSTEPAPITESRRGGRSSPRITSDGPMQDAAKSPSLVSLFAGAGGLDIGLEQAGFRTLLANEIEHHACQTLEANRKISSFDLAAFERWFEEQLGQRCFGRISENDRLRLRRRLLPAVGRSPAPLANAEIVPGDIRALTSARVLELTGKRRGEIDLIAGGPPCQPFSRAGKREMVDCDKGQLFTEFVRLVDETRPRWFLFENVKGLVIQKADIARISCQACGSSSTVPFNQRDLLRDATSSVCPNCDASAQVAWTNERSASLEIILNEFQSIGYSCSHKILNAADFGAPQLRERLFIVGSRDGETFDWPSPTHVNGRDGGQPSLFSAQASPWAAMADTLSANAHWRYGKLDPRKAVLWVKNVVRPHDEPVTWTLDRPAPTIGAHQAAKLAIAPFGVPDAQLQRQQWHVLGRRQGDTPPVPVEHEYLTDEELLALQTFPRSWYLFGTRMERAFQIGNAVPPVLAAAMGQALIGTMNIQPSEWDQANVAVG